MEEYSVLSKKQIVHSRIIMGLSLILLAALLIVLPLTVKAYTFLQILLFSVLLALGLMGIILAFVQSNALNLFLGALCLFCAVISIIAPLKFGYGTLYPCYFLAISLAVLVSSIYSKALISSLKPIILFGALFVLCALNSMLDVSWAIIIPIFIALIGTAVVLSVIKKEKNNA